MTVARRRRQPRLDHPNLPVAPDESITAGTGRPRLEPGLGADELEHLVRGSERRRDGREDVSDGAEAARELLLIQHEGHQRAGVEAPVQHQHSAVPQHQHGDDHGQKGVQERVADDVPRLDGVLAAKLAELCGKVSRRERLPGEGADGPDAAEGLLRNLRRLREGFLRAFRDFLEVVAVDFGYRDRGRHGREGHRRERPRERQHEAHHAQHVDAVPEQDVYVEAQRVAHRAAVVVEPGRQVPGLVLVEETHVLG